MIMGIIVIFTIAVLLYVILCLFKIKHFTKMLISLIFFLIIATLFAISIIFIGDKPSKGAQIITEKEISKW